MIRHAAAAVKTDAAGDPQLVAYVVCTRSGERPTEQIRIHLKDRLPQYMVPSAIMFLDALPLSPAGKVDRGVLPVPQAVAQFTCVPPRDNMERTLAAVWQNVLNLSDVSVYDDFFTLGGDSLKAAKVAFLASDALAMKLAVIDLIREPTVAGLAALVRGRGKAKFVPIPRLQATPEETGAEQPARKYTIGKAG